LHPTILQVLLQTSSDSSEIPATLASSVSGKDVLFPVSVGVAEAVKKLGEPSTIQHAQVDSSQKANSCYSQSNFQVTFLQMQLEAIESFLREDSTDMLGFDFSKVLISDPSKTKDGGNHRLYYIFRNRSAVPDEDHKREDRINACTFRVLLPLMKSGVKIDLVLDFTKSNFHHWFSQGETIFLKFVSLYLRFAFASHSFASDL
jgi:hypothetical protein